MFLCLPARRILAGWITNTNGPAPPAFSCLRAAIWLAPRRVRVEQRTKVDWAQEVEDLADALCRRGESDLVCDNLNTHTKGAFYEAFEPEKAPARRTSPRVPLHAQAWQLAEHCGERTEFADPTVPEGAAVRRHRVFCTEIDVWHEASNAKQRGVDWQFKIDDARRKLKSLYPKIII